MVGNRQRVLLSDLSGRSNVTYKLKQHGLTDRLGESARRELLDRIKHMEYRGYDFETAEGTFELLVREVANPSFHPFDVVSYEVNTKLVAGDETVTTASVVLRVNGDLHSVDRYGPRSGARIGYLPAAVPGCKLSRLSRMSGWWIIKFASGRERRNRIEGSCAGGMV